MSESKTYAQILKTAPVAAPVAEALPIKIKTTKVQKPDLEYGHIFELMIDTERFYFRYLGTFKEFAERRRLKPGKKISIGTFAIEYETSMDPLLRVEAVYKHKGRFYYIDGSFSLPGSMDPQRLYDPTTGEKKFKVVQVGTLKPKTLDPEIVRKVCPGYMDW